VRVVKRLFSRYSIKEGQTDFSLGIASETDDYDITAVPSWKTTVTIVEKTSKGFKLKFETPCPTGGGWLGLGVKLKDTSNVLLQIYT